MTQRVAVWKEGESSTVAAQPSQVLSRVAPSNSAGPELGSPRQDRSCTLTRTQRQGTGHCMDTFERQAPMWSFLNLRLVCASLVARTAAPRVTATGVSGSATLRALACSFRPSCQLSFAAPLPHLLRLAPCHHRHARCEMTPAMRCIYP